MIIRNYGVKEETFMYRYISNQDKILKNISNDIVSEKKMSMIKGVSGTGKSFLLSCIESKNKNTTIIYRLEGDYYLRSRDFYPFLKFINSMYLNDKTIVQKKIIEDGVKNTTKELGSWLPLGNDFLSSCITELSTINKKKREFYNYIFDKEELDILFPLEYFCSKEKKIIFLIDDLQYWDKKSLRLLYTLIQQQNNEYAFLKNSQFIGTINIAYPNYEEELNGLINLAGKQVYELDISKKDNYKVILKQLGLAITLDDDLVEALFSITGGNLQLSSDIVLLLNDKTEVENTIRKIIADKNLGHLLIERLSKISEKGVMVNETLKYASLFGSSFYYHDLENVLEKNESYIRNLIETAQSFCLVNGASNGASFIHELIREAYKNETKVNKVKYYTGYANCLKMLYPGNYKERAESLKDAGEYEKAYLVYILEFFKQLRINNSCSQDLRKELELPYYLSDFVLSMEKAYNLFFSERYDDCLFELESIEDIVPSILLAEKYYLMSITLSKWLDTASRERAVKCIEPFLVMSVINDEIEVWERIVSAYIIACVHNNDCDKAREYESKLQTSIGKRINFDIEASYKLNILRRKASSLYSPQQAFIGTSKSKSFFAPKEKESLPLNPIEYYMSLNNYLATSLMSGKYNLVTNEAAELISLPQKIKYLKFPRFEMPLNNAILIFYLNHKITVDEAKERFQQIIDTYNVEDSTGVIIKVNLAIFYGLSGEFVESLKILETLYNKIKFIENLEFYYKYLVEVNLRVLQYLEENKECIELLENIQKECAAKDEHYLEAHVKCIMDSIKQDEKISPISWYHADMVNSKMKHDDCWKYYGHIYLFGELEFWSES